VLFFRLILLSFGLFPLPLPTPPPGNFSADALECDTHNFTKDCVIKAFSA